MARILIVIFGLLLLCARPALADPCEAIPENGPMPTYLGLHATFSGPVTFVIDGDSLCVAVASGTANWVEVRLADFYAPESSQRGGPEAKAELSRIALGKTATCTAGLRTYDRVAARCSIGGRAIGDMMREAGISEGGRGTPDSPVRHAASSTVRPTASGDFTYRSCAAARAAGVAPMHRGQPNYNPNLDGDGDGIACEPYRQR